MHKKLKMKSRNSEIFPDSIKKVGGGDEKMDAVIALNDVLHQQLQREQERSYNLQKLVTKLKSEGSPDKRSHRSKLKLSLQRLLNTLSMKDVTMEEVKPPSYQKISLRDFDSWKKDMQASIEKTPSVYLKKFQSQVVLEENTDAKLDAKVDPVLFMAYYNNLQHLRVIHNFIDLEKRRSDQRFDFEGKLANIRQEVMCVEELL